MGREDRVKPCGCIECPGIRTGGDNRGKWKKGDRVLVQMAAGDGLPNVYRMATLLGKTHESGDQWKFHEDGVTYHEGLPYSFCVERWFHVPNVLERLAAID
jgi:hypothetical protein